MLSKIIFCSLVSLSSAPLWGRILGTVAEHDDFVNCHTSGQAEFTITGRVNEVSAEGRCSIVLEDATGRMSIAGDFRPLPDAGSRIVISGKTTMNHNGRTYWNAVSSYRTIGKEAVPPPLKIGIADLRPELHDLRNVTVIGRIVKFTNDEIDPEYAFMHVRQGGALIAVSGRKKLIDGFRPAEGKTIEVTGLYNRRIDGARTFTPAVIYIRADADVRVLADADDNVPLLNIRPRMSLGEIARLDMCRVTGTVLATWQPNQYMLVTDGGTLVKVCHRDNATHPHVGERLCVRGYPEMTLQTISLTCADSSAASGSATEADPASPPSELTIRELVNDITGQSGRLPLSKPGVVIRTRGQVRDIHRQAGQCELLLGEGELSIPVDISDHADLSPSPVIGSTIEVTGLCVLDAEEWAPRNAMPRIRGCVIVIRSPDDIRILATPSWWTQGRLLSVIGVLVAILLGIIVWNRLLNRLVEKRSAALLEEQRTSTEAALKIDERTRLAAELHDSLSQNLSALACQVSAAKSTVTDGSETQSLLATAERMLQSSRTELTRCLWDLRGDSLEESDFTNAIRNTLARLVLKAKVVIRFNVPRKRVDDTTAHAILCIVRELVSNAVKHGAATEVRIAGETHENVISFSVRDNGSGFDTEQACGVTEGHFGLEGIRDRVNRLDGTFEIESKPGTGTRATVQLKMKDESTGNEFKE